LITSGDDVELRILVCIFSDDSVGLGPRFGGNTYLVRDCAGSLPQGQ